MLRTAIKRTIGYVWPQSKPMSRSAPARVSFAPCNLQKPRTALQRAVSICRRSKSRQNKQDVWNAITAARVAFGECCECCGTADKPEHRLEGHHRQLASQGGSWTIDNHVLACAVCHTRWHANPAQAVADGWIVVRKRRITPITERKIGRAA